MAQPKQYYQLIEQLSFYGSAYKSGNRWVNGPFKYSSPESYIQGALLDISGGGDIQQSLMYIKDGLKYIAGKPSGAEQGKQIFGNDASMRFFMCWADRAGFLTSPASNILFQGWLSEKGKTMLSDLLIIEKLWACDSSWILVQPLSLCGKVKK